MLRFQNIAKETLATLDVVTSQDGPDFEPMNGQPLKFRSLLSTRGKTQVSQLPD